MTQLPASVEGPLSIQSLRSATDGPFLSPNAIEADTPSSLLEEGREHGQKATDLIHDANSDPIRSTNRQHNRSTNSQRMPFEDAARRIIDHGQGLGSERFAVSDIRIEGNRLFAKDRALSIDAEGFKRLCRHFSAPAEYVENLPAKLRDHLLRHHLSAMGLGDGRLNDRNSRLVFRNETFIDVTRADLHTLGSGEVLNAVRDGFGSDAESFEVQGLEIGQEAFCLDIVSPRVSTEVRRGDVIQAGLRVEHSYVGERATTVMAFMVRLMCTNGMLHRECVGSRQTTRTRRLSADREDAGMLQIEQIRRMTKDVREKLGASLDSVRKLADQKAESRELEQFLRQARMHSSDMISRLRDAWATEGSESTAFGLFNAITRVATHDTSLSARQRGMLARLAGIYANRSTHICPHCFSVRNLPSAN